MGQIIIVPSNGWAASVYSSVRAEFTTGASFVRTGTEATFTTGAAATPLMIGSNRNAASRWPSGRASYAPVVGVQPTGHVKPKARTPIGGAAEAPDTIVQDPRGPADSPPAVDHPKPPPRADKVELTIDSLPNYESLKPIRVVVESLGDKVFVAEAPDLNVSTSGNSIGGALILLKACFHHL
jgi:hypothetical protein